MIANLFTLFSAPTSNRQKAFLAPADRTPITFTEAFDWAGRYAHALRLHGVEVGDRVAVQVEKSPEALFLYLACLRAGAIYLPLNTGYTATELAYFIGDAEPKIFVCSPPNKDLIAKIFASGSILTLGDDGRSGSLVQEASGLSPQFPDAAVAADDLAAILYTSGTTGRSKGAMLTHGNLLSNSQVLKDYWEFSSRDVLLHALPLFHTHGLFVATNVCLAARASMILLPKFNASEILRVMPNATCMMGVPTFYVRLLQDKGLNRQAAGDMRLFISGSAPLLAHTHREWLERTGHAILERYGMTETNMNTSNPYRGKRVPGSVGLALPGTELRIADSNGAPLRPGQIGGIEVRGPNVFKGYWRMPEKTQAEFRPDGFFMTGDLGTIDHEGYIYIVGRGKDLIITGGFNVYPKEIETLIDSVPGVEESAVVGLPHEDFGEGVTAFVVPKIDAKLTEQNILDELNIGLAKFKLPKRILFVEHLPRNAMGKIQKNKLRDEFETLYASTGA